MKAIVQRAYGLPEEVLERRDVEMPVVQDDEVLVRVRAASVHPDVWHVVSGRPYVLRLMGAGLLRPKKVVPGTDLAGRVEAVGKDVTRFRAGDEVFGESIRGYQWNNGGAFAEYASAPERALALKPVNVTFEQAAAMPTAGLIALLNLPNAAHALPGKRVLINGAAGGVGSIALQIAKAYGAHVTGVDHTAKLDLVRALGADHVIDYTRDDFTQGSERYDLIFDIPGNHSFSACRRALTPEGTYVLIGHESFGQSGHRVLGLLPYFFKLTALSLFVKQLPKASFTMPSQQAGMNVLRELLEAGKITPVIDRTFPLSETVQAMAYLQAGRAQGRVVITV